MFYWQKNVNKNYGWPAFKLFDVYFFRFVLSVEGGIVHEGGFGGVEGVGAVVSWFEDYFVFVGAFFEVAGEEDNFIL